MTNYKKCVFHGVEYKTHSLYGNPSYYIYFTDDNGDFVKAYTASNSQSGYTAKNYRYAKDGSFIYLCYHYTKKGNCIITHIKHNSPEQAQTEN